jgi:hypothetical protein
VTLFWASYAKVERDDESYNAASIQITALTQMLAVDSVPARTGLVKFLAGSKHPEATQALAKLAVFAVEEEIRGLAREALKGRPRNDSTRVLLAGLRYPWPAVANRACETIVKLRRDDLAPRLVDLLDEPEPGEPKPKESGGKQVFTVRELVRINHPRNCLLCHAPNDNAGVTGPVPLPSEPLPPRPHYSPSSSKFFVRADVTYLRQDFSVLLPVENADPWPKMQRFDFLVRTRVLTDDDAKAHAEAIRKRPADYVSPYHRIIHAALRELTGRDAGPTAKAWRAVLGERR